MDSSARARSLQGLPLDILRAIFAQLSLRDVLAAESTCRSLRSFVKQKDMWRELRVDEALRGKMTDLHLVGLLKRAEGELEFLDVHGCWLLSGRFLLGPTMRANRGLKELDLQHCPGILGFPVVLFLKSLRAPSHSACQCFGLPVSFFDIHFDHVFESDLEFYLPIDEYMEPCEAPERNKDYELPTTPHCLKLSVDGCNLIRGEHVKECEDLLGHPLDVSPCPTCPMAGKKLVCSTYQNLYDSSNGRRGRVEEVVREDEVGCRHCLVQCTLCEKYYCNGHTLTIEERPVCCICLLLHTQWDQL